MHPSGKIPVRRVLSRKPVAHVHHQPQKKGGERMKLAQIGAAGQIEHLDAPGSGVAAGEAAVGRCATRPLSWRVPTWLPVRALVRW